ncbi:MAG: hypothetical protein KC419_23815 [Anaerolineales bacterium]|nr:hypothetical protein [Anaerolineales bacterium]
MSDPFDWQTEEDGWETPIVPQVETAVSRKPRWSIILVVILTVGTLWFVVQWQVRESVQAATVNVEADFIAAHNFFRQTAVNNDQDLLKPLLSSRDPQWTETLVVHQKRFDE